MVFGDSTATGYGCAVADEVPGVLIARGLAEETGKRIRLSTKAIVGATSKGLSGQIDAMFVAGPPPDAAVIMIGANDITALNGIGPSARRLGAAVRTAAGQRRGRRGRHLPGLRRHHRDSAAAASGGPHARAAAGPRPGGGRARGGRRAGAVLRSAGTRVSARRRRCCSPHDMFHPSAAGYALAAKQLLPALCKALGEWTESTPTSSRRWSRGRATRVTLLARVGELDAAVAAHDGRTRADRRYGTG